MAHFRGVAHVHSTYSFDGHLALGDLVAFFKERGIQFVLMSEHVESLDPAKICSFISDCRSYSSDLFLLIPGIEIDALNGLFYSVQPVEPWKDYEDLARQLIAGGAMAAVSHPVKLKKNIPKVMASLVEGVEIWNSRYDGKMAPNGRIVEFWCLLRQHLGRRLVPLCGIDFHKKHDFTPLMFEVECERLEREIIMAAIRAGSFRIVLSGKTLPLNFASGKLPFTYQLYSTLYRFAYVAIYSIHRAALKFDFFSIPNWLKSLLRRIF
jgi:hypothetical protein